MTDRLTLHWLSFFLHCFGLLLLLFAFALPHWYNDDETMNEWDNTGLWMRCRFGGDCVPLRDVSETLSIHMKPTQILVSLGFGSACISLLFYGLWLWKGEMCDTPWQKRCTWCAETHSRSWKPRTKANEKFRKMKWLAFLFSFMSGVFTVTGSIIFMVNTLIKSEGTPGKLGWCTWMALASAILLLTKNLVISLCSYLLRVPEPEVPPTDTEEVYMTQMDLTDQEMKRVQTWILEQKQGLDNPSFTKDWDMSRSPPIYRTRSKSQSLKSSNRGSSIYYMGQNSDPVELSMRGRGSIYSNGFIKEKTIKPGTGGELFSPMYSVIFKGKIPMIPKKPVTEESKLFYDTIYGWSEGTLPPVLADYYGKYDTIGNVHASRTNRTRPASHLGVTSTHDDMMRNDFGIYNRGRPVSDTDLFMKPRSSQHHRHQNSSLRGVNPSSGNRVDKHQRLSNNRTSNGSLEPGVLPQPYRYRKHPERRSTSGSTSTSGSLASLPSQHPNSSFGYRVRTKIADQSDESIDVPLSMVLSHGVRGLSMSNEEEDFHLEDIWVVQNKDEIKDVLGKGRVHFKLEQSIQELDELELDQTGETREEDV